VPAPYIALCFELDALSEQTFKWLVGHRGRAADAPLHRYLGVETEDKEHFSSSTSSPDSASPANACGVLMRPSDGRTTRCRS
jgi:hypothetical protein